MLIGYKRGQGSIVLRIKILNSSVATGAGLTGLSSASSGLIISTIADNEATATAYTVAASNVETVTTLGTFAAPTAGKCRFREVDSTNHKGVYEIQLADARFSVSNAKSLLVSVLGATNAAETDVVIPLRDLDPFDSVRAGLTAMPNVASGSAGSLLTSGTGTSQLNVSGGKAAANMVEIAGQTVTAATAVTFPAIISSLTAAGVRSELAVELGRIDTTVASRLASASYTAPPSAGDNADAVWDEPYNQHTTAGTFGKLMDILRKANYVTEGSVAAGGTPTTTVFRTDLTEPTGTFDNQTLLFTSGNLAGESAPIESYSVTNGQITLGDALTVAPTAGDAFVILPDHVHPLGEIAGAVLTTAMTESYRATNAAPTLAQAVFELIAHMGEASIAGTTKTLKKINGTTAKTFTLDSGTAPTSITETT
jgi:hypothetical protein